LFGDVEIIPKSFMIAKDDIRFPEALRGKDLGNIVEEIRLVNVYADKREELKALGMTFSVRHKSVNKFLSAFSKYKEIYGNDDVPKTYLIPQDDVRYPEEVRGMRLGKYIELIKTGHIYNQERKRLQAAGIRIITELNQIASQRQRTGNNFASIKQALLKYQELHGGMLIPYDYNIHFNDTRYPPLIWGMNLGIVVHKMRNLGYYSEYKDELEAIGFDYDLHIPVFEDIHQSLLVYKELFGDVEIIPKSFMIAKDDIRFPEALRGKDLGNIVEEIRLVNVFADKREELKALGMTSFSVRHSNSVNKFLSAYF